MPEQTYTDPCTIALQYDKQIYESMCWEEQLSNEDYLDHLDRKLYEKSQFY